MLGVTDTIAKLHVGEDQMEVGVAQIFKAPYVLPVVQLDIGLPTEPDLWAVARNELNNG